MALVDQIIGAESGGDPTARNPNSSASGLGQFIDSTWLSVLRKHRPDLTDGKSDADLLALKSDPDLSRQMTAAYASDNAGILQRAGLPVTPGTTYLAHFAGPQGAVGILNADPSAPVASVLTPAAIRANPFLKQMNVGDLEAWASRKVGGKPAAVRQETVSAPLSMAAAAPSPALVPPPALPSTPQHSASGPLIPEFTDAPAAVPFFQLRQKPIINYALRQT